VAAGSTDAETAVAQLADAPPAVVETIVAQYPGAEIREAESETFEGRPAWEIELTTREGDDLEIFVSESGEILDVSQGLPWIGGELTLGIGVFLEDSAYKGVGAEFQPVPIIRYQNGPLQIVTEDGIELSYGLFGWESFYAGPLASVIIGQGFEEDDSDDLAGMDEPDMTTLGAGLFCLYETPYVEVELKFLNEVLDEHSGQQVELSIERTWEFGGIEIGPGISVQYQSSDWTDYYFGVSGRESRVGRPKYDPGSAFNYSAELMARYELVSGIELIGMVEYTYLDDNIQDSPIIEKDYEIELFVGIMYNF